MTKIYSLFTLGLFLLVVSVYLPAQSINQKVQNAVMPAPNAAALGKYGDIPVSYFTGVPSIEVPITVVQDGPLSLPISLNYHASGIKVGEMASWVGMGWSLNAAGMISRTVQGIADDIGTSGYYSSGSTLSLSTANNAAYGNTLVELANGARDGEPDLFSFTAGELSGKFYIDKNKHFQLVPEQDLKIEMVPGDIFMGFVITKPDGTRYIFGKIPGTTAVFQELSKASDQGTLSAGAWYLLRIETPDKLYSINFTYESESYSYKSLVGCKKVTSKCTTPNGGTASGGYECGSTNGYDDNHRYITVQVSGKRLTKITAGSGTATVTFGASTNREDLNDGTITAKRLEYIQVSSGESDAYCTKFDMSYNYFQDASTTAIASRPESKRLKLLQIQEKACNGEAQYTKPATKFTYNGALVNGKQFLPHRLSKAIDHWGFYNAQNINNDERINVPTTSIKNLAGTNATIDYVSRVNRESSETPMQLGVLERIDYPTGGSTKFSFEANTYNRIVNGAPVFKKLSGTKEALQTSTTPNEQINCGEHTYFSTSPHVTFTSAAELDFAYFKLYLNSATGTSCASITDRVVKVSIFEVSTNRKVGDSFSFNTSNFQPGRNDGNITKKLSDLNANLKVNTAYKFELYVRDGWGKLEVFSYPQVSEVAKAGGLRIKSITSSDGIAAANDVIKTYEYKVGATGTSGSLLYQPRYGYMASGPVVVVDQAPFNYTGIVNAIFFDENSIVPLTSFDGYHIGYSSVKEIYNGNGYTIYDFAMIDYVNYNPNSGNQAYSYPYAPHQLDVNQGKMIKESSYVQLATSPIASTTYSPVSSPYRDSPGTIVRLSSAFNCVSALETGGQQPPSGVPAYFFITYTIRTSAYRLASKTEMLDGVTTVTSNTYDNISLSPKTVTFTNSDGKVSKTTYKYPYDLADGALKTAMVNERYMIGMPIETKVEVGSTVVGGSKVEYSLFSRSTGLPVTSATDAEVYPYKFSDYEMTYNGTTAEAGAYTLKGTIDSYHKAAEPGKGYPKQYTAVNWPAETYEWENGLIKKRTFKEYVWSYAYARNTRLVTSITDIDKQTTSYTYDKLQRLKTISARAANVVTTYDYHYTTGDLTKDKNWVTSSTIFTATAGSSLTKQVSWQYLDGLGRPLQTVEQQHGPNGKDVVSGVKYDNLGRVIWTYSPFETSTTDGKFAAIPATTKYTVTGYESSPLSRVNSIKPPDWYATTTGYGSNLATDAVLKPNSTTDKYAAGELTKVVVTDPMSNATITFTDKKGRVVLSRRASSASATSGADTYNQYDDKDRLIKVVPPDAAWADNDLTFRYTYDKANNLLSKKVPDADVVNYKYTTRDQPALMQDGNLLAQSKWIATVYDDYGRVTKTGHWTGAVPGTITPTTLVIDATNELTKSFYDGTGITPTVSLTTSPEYRGKVHKSMVKVLDGSSTATWLSSINTYDKQGRVTQTTSNNYQNTGSTSAETIALNYDWADNLIKQTRVHKPSSSVTRTLAYRNTYDAAGRRTNYYLKLDSGTEQLLANYTYDERDLLKERNLHGRVTTNQPTNPTPPTPTVPGPGTTTAASQSSFIDGVQSATGPTTTTTYLQSLDYAYNAQGWLTQINQPTLGGSNVAIKTSPAAPNPGAPGASVDQNDLFYLALSYDVLDPKVSGTARKDGNISQVIWRTRGRERQAYSATYDYLSRMAKASYYDVTDAGVASTDQKFSEEVTYADKRGNIKSLTRNGMYPSGAAWAVGQIDKLTYTTTSGTNKLASITEAAPTAGKAYGFNPGAAGTGYTYDKNGNLTKDTYKGITAITYNYLNLPSKISFGTTKSITFTYDAAGRKLKKVTAGGAGAENYTQYYADGLEYMGTTLEAIYHEEGRVTPKTSTTWQYEYSIRDHLGNTRLTFTDKDGDGKVTVSSTASTNEVLQENHYTPFGLELGYAWMGGAGAINKYKFNGKEFNADFGLKWNDHGARFYDAAIARWTSSDPLTASMVNWSPYNYTLNNPLKFTDPTGMAPEGIVPSATGEIDALSPAEARTEDNPESIIIGSNQGMTSQDDIIFRGSNNAEIGRIKASGDDIIVNLPWPHLGSSTSLETGEPIDPSDPNPFAVEMGLSSAIIGGMSLSAGVVFDGKGNHQGYLNIGGVIGAGGSVGASLIKIIPNPNADFHLSDWGGRSTEYFIQVGPITFSHGGNFSPNISPPYQAFTRFGETYTTGAMSSGISGKVGFEAGVRVSNTWMLK